MRKFLIVVVVLLLLVAAFGFFLISTTPRSSAGMHIPLDSGGRALMAQVPASAEAFAIIPSAAALDAKLRANPVTRQAIDTWRAGQPLPRPWMIGGADLIAWKQGNQTRYLLRLDPLRAVLVRMYIMAGGSMGSALLINVQNEPTLEASEIARIIDLASNLPAGDALVVQRVSSRGAFPPMARPAVTSVQVTKDEIRLTSAAPVIPSRSDSEAPPPQIAAGDVRLPRGAMLAASFGPPPRLLGDLNRLFGAKVSSLLENGGSIALYDVDTHKLLPRPIGVIALPDDPQRRAAFESFLKSLKSAEAIGVRARTAEKGGWLLLSFDDSIEQYLKDGFDPPAEAGNSWFGRLDADRLVPILRDLRRNLGLRIASPRLFRAADDLSEWIGGLEQAKTIEASDSVDAKAETLHVRITSK